MGVINTRALIAYRIFAILSMVSSFKLDFSSDRLILSASILGFIFEFRHLLRQHRKGEGEHFFVFTRVTTNKSSVVATASGRRFSYPFSAPFAWFARFSALPSTCARFVYD